VLQTQRAQFEALLLQIAEYAEEWITSAQSLGLGSRSAQTRVLPWGVRPRASTNGHSTPTTRQRAAQQEYEMEYEV
jgi:hypothetical protein